MLCRPLAGTLRIGYASILVVSAVMCIELGCAETLYPEDSRVHRPVLIKVIRASQRKEEAIAVRNGRNAVGLIFAGRIFFVGNTAAHGPLFVNLVVSA